MLTEEQLELFGDQIVEVYQAFEQDVIADIVRRVRNNKRFTETAELMAQAMKAAGNSPERIRTEVMKMLRADRAYQDMVAQNTLEWKEFVKEEIQEMERAAAEAGNRIIAEAGDMSFNYDMAAWEQTGKKLTKDSAFPKLITEMSAATNGTFKNITQTTGFKGAHDFIPLRNAYIKSLDKAVIKMASGVFSYDRCVMDCIKELAQSGLRSVDYPSGKTYQLDTAVRMIVRTACSQLAGKISMQNCDKTGTDLVEVTAHWGARPEHAAWQGKIYSRSGKSEKYPSFSVCRYGEADGLKGVNCRHDFYPFFEGISTPTEWDPEPDPKEYNGKTYNYYQATQKQRRMERDIRATKREIEAVKSIGGDVKALEAKKRKQIKEYHDFSNAMDIRAKDNRLRVAPGSSDLTKTKTMNKINKSRALREKAEKVFSVEPLEKGDVVLAENIYKDLNKSDTGKDTLKFIEDNHINVEILSNKNSIEELGLEDVYGYQIGKNVYINAVNCRTKKKIAETIIHEKTHLEHPDEDSQHIECLSDYMALKRRKGTLTGEDIRNIIKSVKQRYPDKSWR